MTAPPAVDDHDGLRWLDRIACADLDLDGAFPEAGGMPDPAIVAACERCPVRVECAARALSRPVLAQFGYVAGTTQTERRRIVRDRNA